MRLTAAQARLQFAEARVARLATLTRDGRPHIVPIVFVLVEDVIYTAVDAKPKSTTALRRLDNIEANPDVALLADHYADDWTQLWWVRADGAARSIEGEDTAEPLRLLAARYPQYVSQPPPGPVIAIDVARWTGWRAAA